MKNEQEQNVSNRSTAIQAGGDVHITGISVSEVRDIALDVFKSNFLDLSEEAKKIALQRAEEITEKIIQKMINDKSININISGNPDFQYGLFTVQREYARTGDKKIGELLVDLLIDRGKISERNLKQIVLNESLNTAPKLTQSQLSALSIIFLFRYTYNETITDYESFGCYLDHFVEPFIGDLIKNDSCYQHLQFTGCAAQVPVKSLLQLSLQQRYQGLFVKGFDESQINQLDIQLSSQEELFRPCFNDPDKFQFSIINEDKFRSELSKNGISTEEQKKF